MGDLKALFGLGVISKLKLQRVLPFNNIWGWGLGEGGGDAGTLPVTCSGF